MVDRAEWVNTFEDIQSVCRALPQIALRFSRDSQHHSIFSEYGDCTLMSSYIS